eukprot:gene6711-10876_t
MDGHQHRPGRLKQQNKPHKSRFSSKGRLKVTAKGRVESTHRNGLKQSAVVSKEKMKEKQKQRQQQKKLATQHQQRLGKKDGPPKIIGFVPLSKEVSTKKVTDLVLESQEVKHSGSFIQTLILKDFKKQIKIIEAQNNLNSVLEVSKITDLLIFVINAEEGIDESGKNIITLLRAQGIPSCMFVIQNLNKFNAKKQKEVKNQITKSIETEFAGDHKIVSCDTKTEAKMLCRWMNEHKIKDLNWKAIRPYVLVDKWSFTENKDKKGTLQIYGHLRGRELSANHLVYLPKFGTCQISKITSVSDNFQKDFKEVISVPDENQESLVSELIPDPLEGEQTWPTDEELMPPPKLGKKKTTQEEWLLDDEEEGDFEEEEEEEGDEDLFEGLEEDEEMYDDEEEDDNFSEIQSDMQSQIDTKFDLNADETMEDDIREEERQQYLQMKKLSEEDQQFPDEFELSPNQPARIRLQKYRGLKSFRTSPWDPKENLPIDYAKIYQFKDFKLTQKRVLNKNQGVEVDRYYCIEILNVPSFFQEIYAKELLTVYGLLKHEQKKSMMHFQIRKVIGNDDPIKSKDELYCHVGFRTFKCNPIFSEYNPRFKKHKFERFLQQQIFYCASFYAPITYTPAPILIFKKDSITNQFKLLASGTTLGANPDRIVLKKIVLSGHPFKIHKRQAVVRFMFYSPEDIKWFKPVELWTKKGRHGIIKESLGTHGYMKCLFDDVVQGNDTICLSLYKRVYPKWTTEETSL